MVGATAGGNTLAMKYDVDGRRVQLRTTTGSTNTETNYLWDTTTRYGDVLVEIEKNGNIQARYVYGIACGSCSANPVAELISQKRGAITNPREYYLLDGQGSVRGLTDGATGTLTYSYDYDTFGKPSGDLSKSTYLYTGQQYDAATELYSLRARYYSPQQGRFLSQDKWVGSAVEPKELNKYLYVANNPNNYYDPSGYFSAYSIIGAIGLGAIGSIHLMAMGMLASVALYALLLSHIEESDWSQIRDTTRNHRICEQSRCSVIFSRQQSLQIATAMTSLWLPIIFFLAGAVLGGMGGAAAAASYALKGGQAAMAGGIGSSAGGLTAVVMGGLATGFWDRLKDLGRREGGRDVKSDDERRLGVTISFFPPSPPVLFQVMDDRIVEWTPSPIGL
jgi:RHS repeat-associated protein